MNLVSFHDASVLILAGCGEWTKRRMIMTGNGDHSSLAVCTVHLQAHGSSDPTKRPCAFSLNGFPQLPSVTSVFYLAQLKTDGDACEVESEMYDSSLSQRHLDFIESANSTRYMVGLICDSFSWESSYDLVMLQKFGIDMAKEFESGGKVSTEPNVHSI